jgi:hypothetical protein
MRQTNMKLGLVCLAALAWSGSALAEEEKTWFESEPDESKGESSDPETGETAVAAQEEGGVAVDEGKGGGWLTQGSIAVFAGVHLGMGGNLHIESGGFDTDDDLVATLGMQLGGEYIVHPYFAAGAELRLAGVNTEFFADGDVGRDLLVDLLLRPRGRYVFENIGLEAFVALPFGLSFLNINDDKGGDGGVGFALGLNTGASYFFTEKWGLSSDLAWLWHWNSAEGTSAAGVTIDNTLRYSQFTWFVNAVYAL